MQHVRRLQLAVVASVALAVPAGASTLTNSAPADQYFGPLKMSAIGMRNRLDALGKRWHARTITNDDIIHDAKLVEASMDAWQRAYPRDPWIVPTFFHLEQVYQIVQSTNGRTHATTVLKFIAKAYPKTHDAHLARLRLAQGFPPFVALAPPHATPDPYLHESPAPAAPATAAEAGATSTGSPLPVASGMPAPSSSSAPVAAASAAPSLAPAAPSAAP